MKRPKILNLTLCTYRYRYGFRYRYKVSDFTSVSATKVWRSKLLKRVQNMIWQIFGLGPNFNLTKIFTFCDPVLITASSILAAVVAQQKSACLVTERSWARIPLGAGLFLYSILSVVRSLFRSLK